MNIKSVPDPLIQLYSWIWKCLQWMRHKVLAMLILWLSKVPMNTRSMGHMVPIGPGPVAVRLGEVLLYFQ